MKIGDLVRRAPAFKEWMKHNSWMTLEEEQEIGIITGFDKEEHIIVLWSIGESLSWEDPDDIEVINGC